ncbi:MAG: CHASE domain-containing protein [Burkholderiaceae bacterium]|nr:CHASE domain-containing protein [Burkholderiaceae bacterium]
MTRVSAARWRIPALLLAAGLLASAAMAWRQERQNHERAQTAFGVLADRTAEAVAGRMQRYEFGLRGARGAIIALGDGGISREAFSRYSQTRDIGREFPGALGFGFIRKVEEAQAGNFVAAARADGWDDFAIRQLVPHDGDRYVIQYIEPVVTNRAAVGLDLASEERRRAAAEQAMQSGKATISAPIVLVQAGGAVQRSFLLLLPIYRSPAVPASAALRQQLALGWSYAPLVTGEILQPLGMDASNFDIVMRDVSGAVPEEFFRNGVPPAAGKRDGRPHALRRLAIFGRQWEIEMVARTPFVDSLDLPAPASVAAIGVGATILLTLLVSALAAVRRRQREVSREQARLAAVVRHASDAIVGENSVGKITVWNAAAERLFGYSAEQALGQTYTILLQPEQADTDRLGPAALDGECRLLRSDGAWLDVAVTAGEIRDDRGRLRGVTRMVRDIGASKRAQHESRDALARERERLQDILLGTGGGTWEWDIAAQVVTPDLQWHTFLGLAPGAAGTPRAIRALVHPSDRRALRKAALALLALQDAPFEIECRLRHADGHWLWVRGRGHVSRRGPDGKALRVHGTMLDVSGLKQTQRRLAESEAFLERVARVSGVGGWQYSPHSGSMEWTDQTRAIIGAAPGFVPTLQQMLALLPEPGEATLMQALQSAEEQGEPFDLELSMRTMAGAERQVHIVGEVVRDSNGLRTAVGALLDVTRQRAMEAELRRINRTQSAILDNMPCGLSVFDADLKLVGHNQQFRTLLDLDALFANGLPSFPDIIRFNAQRGEYGPVDIEAQVAHAIALAKNPVLHNFERIRPDGTPLEIRGAPLPGGGFVTTYTDMSERKRNEARLLDAMHDAEAASRAKSEFVANMSHEIRTPMNAVLGMAQLLGTTSLNVEQRNYLDMITASGQALLGILNDVLDFSKIGAGRMELAAAPFQLDSVLTLIAGIMAASASNKDLDLAIGVQNGIPVSYIGDAQRLQQILINLVSNAIKFTASGEVVLLVEAEDDARQGTTRLRIRVRDTGIGMDGAQLARVFAAFTQGDASVTRQYGGTGLGLAISNQLAAMMGGDISVNSVPGHGTEFVVTIPLQLAQRELPAPAAEPLRLLLIDAHATSRACIAMTIRSCGWQVDEADSAVEGLRLAEMHPAYDAVLADWHGVDAAVLLQLRALDVAQAIPLLILQTAYHHGQLPAQATALSPDAMLFKPITARALMQTLLPLTSKGQQAPATAALHMRFDGVRILLVEDNALNQQVARGMLVKLGIAVEVAGDGAEAVALLRANPQRCDLILMDVQMPVLDGLSATALLRRDLGLQLPILAMTAGVTMYEQAQCRQAGMNDIVAKPVSFAHLAAALARQLRATGETPAPLDAAGTPPEAEPAYFDPDSWLALCGDDPASRALLLSTIEQTLAQAPAQLADASAASAGGDTAGAARALHALRGSVGQLGARVFINSCLLLERHLREQGSHAPDLFDEAAALLHKTVELGQAWLAEQEPAELPAVPASELPVLLDLLAEGDMGAISMFAGIHDQLGLPPQPLHEVDQAMEQLDFEATAALLRRYCTGERFGPPHAA